MGEQTAIAWSDHTFNGWWGCVRVSAACDICYAETFAKRLGFDIWGKDADRRFFGEKHWNEPRKWDRSSAHDVATGDGLGRRHRVFCSSMADVFEPNPVLVDERAKLFRLIEETPNLDWQLLTKRPEQVARLVPPHWLEDWPAHAWLGATVEDQKHAELRLPRLLAVPGVAVRFLSCEPLLGPVDLSRWFGLEWMDALRLAGEPLSFRGEGGWGAEMFSCLQGQRPAVSWIICGGESGNGFRPLNLDYARDLRDQCAAAEVPFFFKQVGGRTPTVGGDRLDGRQHNDFPMDQRKGSDVG